MLNYDLLEKKSKNALAREASFLEQEINQRLIDRCDFIKLTPKTILEIGCGPGYGIKLLQQRFPQTTIVGLDINYGKLAYAKNATNAEQTQFIQHNFNHTLPFKPRSFDLIIANLTIQHSDHLLTLFNSINQLLKKDGFFMFSLLGSNSLNEFRQAWLNVDDKAHHNPLINARDLASVLQYSSFDAPVLDMESLTLTYASLDDAIADIREFGEELAANNMRQTLTGANRWESFERIWQSQMNDEGKLPCSYEIIYGHSVKSEAAKQNKQNNQAQFSLDEMRSLIKEKN